MRYLILLIFSASAIFLSGCEKRKGCTDEEAINYDSLAGENDGSCEYCGCKNEDAPNYENADNVVHCPDSSDLCDYRIVYKVTGSGSGSFDVTYDNSSDGTSQETVTSGWTYDYTRPAGYGYDFLYISAQCNDESCNVTTKIIINGDVFKESSSSGDYVIATSSGNLEDY